MPRPDYTDITIVLDRSGSMQPIREATVEGLNGFINEQKTQPGYDLWTLIQFNHEYKVVFKAVPAHEVRPLTRETFVPRGSTALVDAVCRTIDETGRRLAALPEHERPARVLVVILTDGEENSSRTFSKHDLADRIRHQQDKYGWNFVFLGANQDAIATADSYEIKTSGAFTYDASREGTQVCLAQMSGSVSAWKSGQTPTVEMTSP